jgi:hypothetical protein
MGSIICRGREYFEPSRDTLKNTEANQEIVDENTDAFSEMEDFFILRSDSSERIEKRVSLVHFSDEVHTISLESDHIMCQNHDQRKSLG